MTTKIDGTNGVLQAYDYQVLTTGFTYTFAAGTQVLVAVPASTLATGTITMPSAPADGMVITIQSSQQITALTLNGNAGQTVVGTAVQIVPNQPLSWVYRLTNTTWYPFAGGAGRASSVVTGTAVASTSGTSIDYTNLPSWVKRITVIFNGVSLSGAADLMIRIGPSGGVETSGYTGTVFGNGIQTQWASGGYQVTRTATASSTYSGSLVLFNVSGNIWVASATMGDGTNAYAGLAGGTKTLAGLLTQIRVTTTNGIDTFDAGSVNILYE